MTTAVRFNAATTRATLTAACDRAGLDSRGAELIRMGENALYRLASAPIMARVGRSAKAGRKELNVAAWLTTHDFPAVQPADVRQPVANGHMAVTFWEFIDATGPPATSAELGDMLRRLHELPAPNNFALPAFQPMPKVAERLAQLAGKLPEHDIAFLTKRKQYLDEAFSSLTFTLDQGPIHGDAHRSNLLRDPVTRSVRLIDLEDFCIGPREWDLCVEAVGYEAFGWISPEDYGRYVQACGFDALQWSGFRVVRAIRELNMTTWLAQMVGQSPAVDAEVRKRIGDLRDGDAPRAWSAF